MLAELDLFGDGNKDNLVLTRDNGFRKHILQLHRYIMLSK